MLPEDFLVLFLVEVPVEVSPVVLPVAPDLVVVVCELLPVVVVAVSSVVVQDATNARPTTATMEVRRDFFIDV